MQRAGAMPLRLREIRFGGLAAIELVSGRDRMMVVHEVGPRIAWFGRGDNLLTGTTPVSIAAATGDCAAAPVPADFREYLATRWARGVHTPRACTVS